MKQRQQSSTDYAMTFLLVSSSDHVTPVTGVTPAVALSKNGGSFSAASGAVNEIGNGWYALAGDATDRNTLGALLLHATATGADPADDRYTIVPWNPFDGDSLGLSRIDAAVPTRSTYAGADTTGTTTLLSRVGSALTITDGKVDVNDKAGYSLTAAYDAAKTAGDATTANQEAIAAAVAALGSPLQAGTSVAPTAAEIADRVLGRALAGGADGGRTVRDALRALRNKVVIENGVMTVYAEDAATVAWTAALTTDSTALPITGVDPE